MADTSMHVKPIQIALADQLIKEQKALEDRKQELVKERKEVQYAFLGLFAVASGLLALGVVNAFTVDFKLGGFMIIGVALLVLAFMQLSQRRGLDAEIADVAFQLEVIQDDVGTRVRRAERVFHHNTMQLRKYYSLNLRQNLWVFLLGVGCILLGAGIVVWSVSKVLAIKGDLDTQIVTGALGAVGGFLTNFVAVIFLKMNKAATKNLGKFHDKLTTTQYLLLGNVLTSRIEEDTLRDQTLATLAITLAQGDDGPEVPQQSAPGTTTNGATA